ncbi:hypothetical protein PAHAL_8G030100 [Panicum hallii]|uniref:Uncharacterized protein n=1 Tax=Panicum hallii TaxID=206008 RepID=A0A2T8I7F5_9POAL|nr:hypothetical protein PAHAL_8G030100 [Panicum hallii]
MLTNFLLGKLSIANLFFFHSKALCKKQSASLFTLKEANGVARTRRMNITETPLSFPLRSSS